MEVSKMSGWRDRKIGRELIKAVLRPLMRWRPLRDPLPGFSIVIGAPWLLRHMLGVNLSFVRKMDLTGLDRIYIVFDRTPKPGADRFIDEVKRSFPELPLHFQFYPRLVGSLICAVNQAHFYASMNWVVGLQSCRTRYAILHDFDLYPTQANMFAEVVRAMQERSLRFSGTQIRMDDEWFGVIDPPTIGSCELGIDVPWLRGNSHPLDMFRKAITLRGTRCMLDSTNYVQLKTPARAVAETVGRHSYVHADNLCATYLEYTVGRKYYLAWRLHMLWYLESLSGPEDKLHSITDAMRSADSSILAVDGHFIDFSGVSVTCSNVLRNMVQPMEKMLFGECRREVTTYVDEFESFLRRCGDNGALN